MDRSADKIHRRIRDLEFSARFQEAKTHEALTRLEEIVAEQRADIGRLEDLVYRLMHRKSRLSQSSTGTGTWTSGPVVESPVHATAPSVVEIGLPDRFKRASRHQASRDDTDTTAVGNSGLLVPNRKESVFRSRRMSLPAIARPRSR